MRGLSLFSGIGGLDLAAEAAGVEIVGQVEIDPYCQQILARHWPTVPRIADVRSVIGCDFLGPVDIIFAGIPCQPFSVAGKRRGNDDSRYLWPELRRVARLTQPSWVVVENVANITRMALDDIWSDLETDGYRVGACVLPAYGVGAPHKRERAFIVAYAQRRGRRRWAHAPSRHDSHGQATEWDQGAHGTAGAGEVLPRWGDRTQDPLSRYVTAEFESMLGRDRHGLPYWVDGARWPATPTQPQYEWEPPRVTELATDTLWRNRVRALGNAVCPQQAYPVFRMITDFHELAISLGLG